MSYYANPYDYFPVHSRYPQQDPHRLHPHDLHHPGELHPEDSWYGPPPPAPALYPAHLANAPPPSHFASPYDAILPYEVQGPQPPMMGLPHHVGADRPATSSLGNSFAIPKGTRNALHRVSVAAAAASATAATGANGDGARRKTTAQSVGATTTANPAQRGNRVGGMAASSNDVRLVPVKSEKGGPSKQASPALKTLKQSTSSSSLSSSASTPKTAAGGLPKAVPSTNGAPAASQKPSVSPTPASLPAQTLHVPQNWKRLFESARLRSPGEVGVAAPVVELASQMLNKRCMSLVPGDEQQRRFTMVIDATILRRGVLSSRSNEGMTVALYLFMPTRTNVGELVSTEAMLCRMKVSVDETRLLPASGMSNGVQINLLPALTKDKFNKKNLAISIESHPEDFPQGFAMVCLRRLENQICVNRGTPVPVPSLLRRHSAPTRPVFPVNVPMITTAGLTTKRSASTMSSSPNPPSAIQAASPKIVNSTSLACQSPTTVATPNTLTTSSSFATVRSRTPGTTPAPSSNKRPNTESVSLSDSDPDQVEIGDQIVSLICPISLSRISLPGKGANCKHVQCFDLTTFTNLFRVCKKWKCAVCGEAIGTEELCVSGTFLELLEAYPLGEKCVVKAKGGHAPYVEDKCGPKRKKARRSESAGAGQEGGVAEEPMPMVVVVDLCDDEEDSGKQESPTKHVTLNDSMNSQQASDIIVPIHAPPSTNSSSTTTPPEYMSSRSTMPHHHHHQSIHNTYRYPAASDVAPAAEMDMAVPSPVESQPCSRADRITTSPVPIAVAGQARYSEGFHNDHQDGHDRNDEQTDYSTPPMYWVDRRGSPSSTLSPQKSLSNRLSHPMTPLERDERIQRIFDEVARESSQQRSLSERDEDRRGRVGGMCVGVEDGNEGPGQDQE